MRSDRVILTLLQTSVTDAKRECRQRCACACDSFDNQRTRVWKMFSLPEVLPDVSSAPTLIHVLCYRKPLSTVVIVFKWAARPHGTST